MEHLNKTPKVKKNQSMGAASGAGMGGLMNAMHLNSSVGRTQNNAKTFIRTKSPLLDFYAQAGAMRQDPKGALDLFQKAFAEDRQTAVRILFYLRDVRGGQGERDLFRTCLEWIGTNFPGVFKQIVDFVPEYGRWDDVLFNDPACVALVKKQLAEDMQSDTPSLLAKWLPTINASSPTTRKKAFTIAKLLSMGEVEYRRAIRALRKKIKTVEEQMSARKWEDINYSAVPSQASRIYKDAFLKHDEVRYGKFVEKAVTGEVKINAATLYPYQIYQDAHNNYSPTLEALWNQLPDYTQGKNALVVADVSGSMSGTPISVSVSLALYFAERNKGQFKDYFVTFSAQPRLQMIQGQTLLEKMNSIEQSQWDMNTNLEAVFELVLNSAVENDIEESEMPETLYIISDMEFDEAMRGTTLHDSLKEKYEVAGYKLPNVVYWNVNASGKNLPVRENEQGVALVSGFSPVIFRMVTENKTPLEVMLETINAERYAPIVVK